MESKIEKEWLQLKADLLRLSKLVSPDVLNKTHLTALEKLSAKFTANGGDDILLKALNMERRRLEVKVYPGVARRLLYRVFNFFIQKKAVEKVVKHSISGKEQVFKSLKKTGLTFNDEEITRKMEQGLGTFTHPVSISVSEKERLDITLNFEQHLNGYLLESFKATLVSADSPRQVKFHTFKVTENNTINTQKAYNLLSGRAIADAEKPSEWIQFDLTDKDAQGNYVVKRFPKEFDFDLDRSLAESGIREMVSLEKFTEIEDSLRKGNCIDETIVHNGVKKKLYLQANPGKKDCGFQLTDLIPPKIKVVEKLKVRHTPVIVEKKKPTRKQAKAS